MRWLMVETQHGLCFNLLDAPKQLVLLAVDLSWGHTIAKRIQRRTFATELRDLDIALTRRCVHAAELPSLNAAYTQLGFSMPNLGRLEKWREIPKCKYCGCPDSSFHMHRECGYAAVWRNLNSDLF